MTLTARIKNEGNNQGDMLVLKGVWPNYYKEELEDGTIGSFTFGGLGIMSIPQGKSVTFWPNCDHFGDFNILHLKGKH